MGRVVLGAGGALSGVMREVGFHFGDEFVDLLVIHGLLGEHGFEIGPEILELFIFGDFADGFRVEVVELFDHIP